jgi:MFS family permease
MKNFSLYFPQFIVALAGELIPATLENFFIELVINLIANSGAFVFGISFGWSSPAVSQLFSKENEFHVSKTQLSWIVSLMALGAATSTTVSGVLRNKLGTKLTIALFGVPTTIGWLLILFAKNSEMVRD